MKKLNIAAKCCKYYTPGLMQAFDTFNKELLKVRSKMREDDRDNDADFVYLKVASDIKEIKSYINSIK